MRKEKLVTRTFTLTDLDVMTVDVTTAEVNSLDLTLVGSMTTDVALKKAKELIETDTLKVVNVTMLAEYTELRGMTDQQFYEASQLLPDRKDYSKEEGDNNEE